MSLGPYIPHALQLKKGGLGAAIVGGGAGRLFWSLLGPHQLPSQQGSSCQRALMVDARQFWELGGVTRLSSGHGGFQGVTVSKCRPQLWLSFARAAACILPFLASGGLQAA